MKIDKGIYRQFSNAFVKYKSSQLKPLPCKILSKLMKYLRVKSLKTKNLPFL